MHAALLTLVLAGPTSPPLAEIPTVDHPEVGHHLDFESRSGESGVYTVGGEYFITMGSRRVFRPHISPTTRSSSTAIDLVMMYEYGGGRACFVTTDEFRVTPNRLVFVRSTRKLERW